MMRERERERDKETNRKSTNLRVLLMRGRRRLPQLLIGANHWGSRQIPDQSDSTATAAVVSIPVRKLGVLRAGAPEVSTQFAVRWVTGHGRLANWPPALGSGPSHTRDVVTLPLWATVDVLPTQTCSRTN
ncbi:hypothetical protein K439DRAFT_1612399 [Ramaria rubella]|nr:hypothetical protein K439DRAFT_1612399 [Ramaria rubella]